MNVSKWKPSLHHIAFDSQNGEQLPATPVLSILQFKFGSAVNLDDPSQPVSVLWRVSVEFISTISGFQGLYWAPVDQNTIIILIQWDSGFSWRRFQCSMGFSMLLGYLEQVYNRCVMLALPAHLTEACFRLELVSYDFPARSYTSQNTSGEHQDNFKDRWEILFKSHVNDGLVYACGGWIQDDCRFTYPCFGPGGQIEEGFQAENQYFAGLVFWNTDIELNISSETADQVTVLSKEADVVASSFTERIRYKGLDVSASHGKVSDLISTQSNSEHPLFNVPVIRRCDLGDLDRLQGKDKVHLAALKATLTDGGKRKVPSPAGNWFSMGSINQHHMPTLPDYTPRSTMEMISFCVWQKCDYFMSAFADLRAAMWKLGDCPPVHWGTDYKDSTRVFLLLEFDDIKSAPVQTQAQFHQLIGEFEIACKDMIQNLTYTQIPGPQKLGSFSDLEIMTFHVPDHESDIRSFEWAYHNLMQTTYVHNDPGLPISHARASPVHSHGIFYTPGDRRNEKSHQLAKFTSVWSWSTYQPGQARTTWYAEFAERAQNEYECLGHIVDWLRIHSKSSESLFLVLERDDKVIELLQNDSRSKKYPPQPGPGFGGALPIQTID
ncbi:uncharacterized protein N7482_002459 [Penicillium canariense]|uniref:Uncharacterized protein n=1 Tax=Penicillium canariense TaxID=189055 RepID=A0A9W9LV59_9EURO|nr:uncharacterized protein N7482_002459 [Penicillium canariense]KAJ5176582.1 hypothetical protein N7482_002459 [Penicillium canariense]